MSAADIDDRLRCMLASLTPQQLDRLKTLVDARTSKTPPPPTDGPETYRGVPVPETLHHNWDQCEASWWRAGVRSARQTVVPVLLGLDDGKACESSEDRVCTTHGDPWPVCPMDLARSFRSAGPRREDDGR